MEIAEDLGGRDRSGASANATRRRAIGARWRQGAARIVPIVLVIAVACAAIAPAIAVPGIVSTRAGGDSPFVLQRTHQMAEALAAGHVPPRWMPDAAYELGYPFWNFYAPLAYLVAGAIAFLGGGVIGAVKVTALIWFVVAAVGAWRLGRATWGADASGVLVAVAYTVAPYHLVNVYVRGDALAEVAAYALFPWVLLAVERAVSRADATACGGLAGSLGLLLISHNISALLLAPLIGVWTVWRLWSHRGATADGDRAAAPRARSARAAPPPGVPPGAIAPLRLGWSLGPLLVQRLTLVLERRWWAWRRLPFRRRLVTVAVGAGLGIALTAWFWAPALIEARHVQLEANVSGYFDYRGHFRGADLLDLAPAFDYRAEAPWRTGVLSVIVAMAGAIAAGSMRRRDRGLAAVFWAMVALGATFMITPLSRPLWEIAPLLRYAQFPWRWLSIQALALAMLAGPLGAMSRGRGVAALAAVALAASALLRLPIDTLAVHEVSRADLTAFELFSGNIGTTVRGEYLPVAVAPRPMSSATVIHGRPARPRAVDAGGVVDASTLLRSTVHEQQWRIEVSGTAPITVAFPTLAFPGWEAQIAPADVAAADDRAWRWRAAPQPVAAVPGSGWIAVPLAPGRHTVTLRLARTTVRAWAEVTSLVAAALWLALLLVERRRRWGRALMLGVVTVAACVVAAHLMPVAPQTGPRTLDWTRGPYPHFNPDGLRYGRVTLLDARLSSASAAVDDVVRLSTTWSRADAALDVEAALVSPAEVLPPPGFGVADVWSRTSQSPAETLELALTVPREIPDGMYFLRLRVTRDAEEVPAVDADGHSVGTVYLGPLRVTGSDEPPDGAAPALARMGDLALHAVDTEPDADRLMVRMRWEVTRDVAREYKTSVRLIDPTGDTIAQVDALPGYGFSPTTAWSAGASVIDRRWLSVPSGARRSADYRVEVVAYEEISPEIPLGTVQVGGVKAGPRPR